MTKADRPNRVKPQLVVKLLTREKLTCDPETLAAYIEFHAANKDRIQELLAPANLICAAGMPPTKASSPVMQAVSEEPVANDAAPPDMRVDKGVLGMD
uniref:Uncharacterized protein n=1 Tax=viral metagenome TaxID=1070528 RepID=A0A2V0RAE3_9ZZZZ